MLRRVLVSLAIATWCLLNPWLALGDARLVYFLRRDPRDGILPGVLGCEAIVALTVLFAWEAARRIPRFADLAERIFLIACAIPAGIAATAIASLSPAATRPIQSHWFWPAATIALAFPMVHAMRSPKVAGRWMRSVFLWSWPVLATIVFQAARATLARYRPGEYADLAPAAKFSDIPKIRVVWIIFDEMSQELAFDRRPPGLDLVNFDRLKGESFYATDATAPGDATLISLPALILGERVMRAEPDGPADLRIETRAGWDSWKSRRNVFDAAHAAGFNTAIAGWYHPYGRLFGRSVSACFWVPNGIDPGAEETLGSALQDRAWLQISSVPLLGRFARFSLLRYDRELRIRDFLALKRHALETAADSQVGLALIHLPAPHPPGIYDRATGAMDGDGPSGYVDNLVLADRTLGELRSSIEQAGLWDRTAVIVSADHGWRVNLWRGTAGWTPEDERLASGDVRRVPFILKLPGESTPLVYQKKFDTVMTRQIVMDLLMRRIATAGDVAAAIH